MTFQASVDGGVTWNEITTAAGAAYTVAWTGCRTREYCDRPDDIARRAVDQGCVRGTKASPVNQTSTVTVTLVTKLVF